MRTAVNGGAWATPEQSISYAEAGETGPVETPPVEGKSGEGKPVETETTETVPTKPVVVVPSENPQAAPALTVSGETISWQEVAGVTTYVLATKVPGQETSSRRSPARR